MKVRKTNILFFLFFLAVSFNGFSHNKTKKEPKVFVFTIDGLRWKNVFNGIDSVILSDKRFVSNEKQLKKLFWAETKNERAAKLLPFLVGTPQKNKVLIGNRDKNSFMSITNKMKCSYPGYSEIVCGYADDENIRGNDKIDNPNVSIFEIANKTPKFKEKVLIFGSWDTFPYIFNEKRSGLRVNAGYRKNKDVTQTEKLVGKISEQIPRKWEGTRYDVLTNMYAIERVKAEKPRLVFLGYGESDDYAHNGRYDHYLKSAKVADEMIKEWWDYVQSDPYYKDQTLFIITTDHGRGGCDTEKDVKIGQWRHHGSRTPESDETWAIFIGKGVDGQKAETKGEFHNNQFAETIAKYLNIKLKDSKKRGEAFQFIKYRP